MITRKNNVRSKTVKVLIGTLMVLSCIFYVTSVQADYNSSKLFVGGKLDECSKQKRGGASCLKDLNQKSCINTTPFSPIGGVSSEMCARGRIWCQQNDPHRKHKRCQNVAKGIVKNHEGYDYRAACGTTIQAPCDGRVTNGKKNGLRYECSMCGKTIEYTFYHNRKGSGNGTYKKGQKIGESGDLNGYPCHMHIEIRADGVLVDPMNSGFDAYVCSCKSEDQRVNRMSCFGVGSEKDVGVAEAFSGASGGDGDTAPTEFAQRGACDYISVMNDYHQFGCIFCTPFRILFNAASVMAKKTYDTLAKAVVGVVVIGFAIWLALVVMRFVSHFETRDPRIFVKTMLNQAFRVLVVVLLLQGPVEQLMSMTLDPLFATGLKLAQMTGGMTMDESASGCGLEANSSTAAPEGSNDSTQGAVEGVVSGNDQAGLSPEMGNGIICTIKNTQDQIIDVLALARVTHCLAWEKTTLVFIPNFAYLITALLFFIAAFILLVTYPFLLVDSVLKMAVSVALLPAALGAYAFKITSKYLAKVFGTFIDAIMTFIFLSLVIMIVTSIAKQYVTDILTDDIKSGGMLGTIVWFTIGAIKIIFVLFLGWAVLGDIKEFAKKFAGSVGGGGGIGGRADIGSAVGLTANSLFKNYAVDPAMKFAKKRVKSGAALAKENIGHGYRKVKSMSFTAISRRAKNDDGTDMLDEGGNQMYKTGGSSIGRAWNAALGKMQKDNPRSWLAQKFNNGLKKAEVNTHSHYRSYGSDASGNLVETKTRINRDGSKVVVQRDVFGSVATAYDKNGNVIKQTTKPAKSLKQMINKRGEIDTATVAAFVQSSLMSHTNKQLMIMETLINSRMGNYEGGRLDGRFVSRNTRQFVDDNGNQVMQIIQQNENGSVTTFTAQFKGKRVMTNVSTMDKNGKGVSYETDGIIQRKSIIDGDNVTRLYSVAEAYSNRALHAVHIDGSVSDNLPKDEIMFSDNDLQEFGQQVLNHGNKAYTFTEFK